MDFSIVVILLYVQVFSECFSVEALQVLVPWYKRNKINDSSRITGLNIKSNNKIKFPEFCAKFSSMLDLCLEENIFHGKFALGFILLRLFCVCFVVLIFIEGELTKLCWSFGKNILL